MDLNSDLGEGAGFDTDMLAIVTSASVACGFHAGSAESMRSTVREAARLGVAIGAHPGYHDRDGFGRRPLDVSPAQIEAEVIYQIGALQGICAAEGTSVRYVKPHGALYNRCAVDADAARAVVRGVRAMGSALPLLALAGSELARQGERAGLRVFAEAFADRGYAADGTLLPRDSSGAVITDPAEAAERALRIATEGVLVAHDGSLLRIQADSICVHGDTPGALAIAAAIRECLAREGVSLVSFTSPSP